MQKMKVKIDITKVTIFFSDVNKQLGVRKAAGSGPTSTTMSGLFRGAAFVRVRLMSNLSLEKVRFCIRVRLQIQCGFFMHDFTILAVGFLPRSSHDDPGTPILVHSTVRVLASPPTILRGLFFFDCSLPRP